MNVRITDLKVGVTLVQISLDLLNATVMKAIITHMLLTPVMVSLKSHIAALLNWPQITAIN